MRELVIRAARVEELGVLEALQMRASLAWEEYREALLAHPEAVQLPVAWIEAGHVFAVLDGEEIAGFCVVLPRDDGDADIDGLFVDPGHWRAGLGTALVNHARRIAQSRSASVLHVVATPRARKFYETCGFELSGDTPTRFGPALAMQLSLSSPR